ncbi:MAG: hypothetical protein M1269_07430 [Chloroflexi bacterium]|nr:hypothetical protein [Chloroflexota bacterium]
MAEEKEEIGAAREDIQSEIMINKDEIGHVDEKTAELIEGLNKLHGEYIKKEIQKTKRKEFIRFVIALALALYVSVVTFQGTGKVTAMAMLAGLLTIIFYLIFFIIEFVVLIIIHIVKR